MARLRESRNKFLSRFRPPAASQSCDKGAETVVRETIQSVMMEEWEELRGEVWETDPTEGYLDHVIGIMDELREELIREGTYVCVCACVKMYKWFVANTSRFILFTM